MSYTPQLDSIPHKVIAYFKRLPDEELSNKDISLKYSCAAGNVKAILAAAVQAGCLKQDGSIYSAGDHIAEAGISTTGTTPPTAQTDGKQNSPWCAPKRKPAKQCPPVHIDFSSLQVETSIPVSDTRTAGVSKWQPLFNLLTQPGQSVQLPKDVTGAIGAEMAKRKKTGPERYKKAIVSATHFRIWRTL